MITKSDDGTLIHSDLNIEDEYLMHYGVKGMKWRNRMRRGEASDEYKEESEYNSRENNYRRSPRDKYKINIDLNKKKNPAVTSAANAVGAVSNRARSIRDNDPTYQARRLGAQELMRARYSRVASGVNTGVSNTTKNLSPETAREKISRHWKDDIIGEEGKVRTTSSPSGYSVGYARQPAAMTREENMKKKKSGV